MNVVMRFTQKKAGSDRECVSARQPEGCTELSWRKDIPGQSASQTGG